MSEVECWVCGDVVDVGAARRMYRDQAGELHDQAPGLAAGTVVYICLACWILEGYSDAEQS